MAHITMVFGEIGAGKTTHSKMIEGSGGVRLSLDEWTIAATGDRVQVPADVLGRMLDQLMRLWPNIVRGGQDVVLDFGFWDRERRDQVRELAAELGADVSLVHVWCDEDERRRRCLSRLTDLDTYAIDAGAFDWITENRTVVALGDDEPHVVVDTSSGSEAAQ